MITAAHKRKYLAEFKDHPVIIAAAFLKCSVCALLIALLLVIGMQAPDSAFDSQQLVAESVQQSVPYSFYVK
jgi:hypothetical protein